MVEGDRRVSTGRGDGTAHRGPGHVTGQGEVQGYGAGGVIEDQTGRAG